MAYARVRNGMVGGGRRAGAAVADGMRRYRNLLRDRRTATLLRAGMASELGDWFNTVAVLMVAYEVGGGSVGVGFVLALRMVPRLVFQGPAGALVDRWPGAWLLVGSQLLMGVIATAFALLVVFPELWLLCLLIVLLEIGNTVAWPAFRVQLVRETPPDQFAAVNGLLSTGLTASQFIGPVLGGLVLAALGPAPVFIINGLTFAAVAAAFTWVHRSRDGSRATRDVDSSEARSAPVASSGDAADPSEPGGYGWLLRQTDLALFAAAALGVTIAVRGAISLFVDRSDVLGLGSGGPGYFFAAVGFGAVVGGVGAGAGSHAGPGALRGAAVAMIICATALAGFGTVDSVIVAIGTLVIAGLATNVYEVLALTYFQHRLPAVRYGRFMSIFILALGIGGIVGALAAPLLATVMRAGWALAVLALPGVGLALALLARTVVSAARSR